MSYQHLSLKQRFRLETCVELGFKQKEMALSLGVHPTTISREFARYGEKEGYRAQLAHSQSKKRRKSAKRRTKKLLVNVFLRETVLLQLQQTWSPEQVTERVRKQGAVMVCKETIYQFIYQESPLWKQYLRQKKRSRRKYGIKRREQEREEAKKKRIDTRPKVVETRERIGDWEGDTIVGGERTSGILTHVERRSGYLIADLFFKKSAEWVQEKTVERFKTIHPDKKHTLTYDNGSEFSDHERLERFSGIPVYFAYPYHSWERGTNENTNGLLREFFPKKMNFASLRQQDVEKVVTLINHRPRKRLGYLTPYEVFVEEKEIALEDGARIVVSRRECTCSLVSVFVVSNCLLARRQASACLRSFIQYYFSAYIPNMADLPGIRKLSHFFVFSISHMTPRHITSRPA
jgi:transposase, IS30 family